MGEDGPTHHGVFDLSYLREMPNMTIFVPRDEGELRGMLAAAIALPGPAAVRYPRGAGLGVDVPEGFPEIDVGKAELLSDKGEIAFLALGPMVAKAQGAAKILQEHGIEAGVVNMRFAKPLDEELLAAYGRSKKLLVTVEENILAGGFGSMVAEYLLDNCCTAQLLRCGLPDKFVEQGKREDLLALCGLQPETIAARSEARWKLIQG